MYNIRRIVSRDTGWRKPLGYVGWAVLAMVSYGVTVALLKVALRHFPPEVALVVTNTFLVAVGLGLVAFRGESFFAHFNEMRPTLFVLAAGGSLSLAIASYYIALSRGPVSAVAPIFAMSFAVAVVLGVLLLDEPLTATRLAGMGLAAGAVFLLTR